MTNWHSPILLVAEAFAYIKVLHVAAGVYFWELVLNLDFEYSVLTGKRKLNLGVPLYLICRWFTLLAMIMHLLGVDNSDEIDCQAWITLTGVFSYIAYQSSTSLIILRILALWEKNRTVVVVTIAILLADATAFVYNAVILRAHRIANVCIVDHILDTRVTIFTTFITGLILLSLMLFGVLRWKHARQMSGIWRIMYTQGLLHVVVITIAEPPVVFIALNLNDVMNGMFDAPSMVIMAVGVTRMYRGLVDSNTLNNNFPAMVVRAKGLPTKEEIFARPTSCREQDSAGGSTLDSNCSTANFERIVVIKNEDVETFGSETV